MQKYFTVILVLCISLSISAANLKGQNRLIDGIDEYRFYIKLSPDFNPDVENGRVRFFSGASSVHVSLKNILDTLTFHQVLPLTGTQRAEVRSGGKTRAVKGTFNRKLFSGLLELADASSINKHELLNLANELEKFDEVEYCEVSPMKQSQLTLPMQPSHAGVSSMRRGTPDFSDLQLYKYGDLGGDTIGIYAEYAWELGIKGEGVKVADVELAWTFGHEDLAGSNFIEGLAVADYTFQEHGTAVAGVIFAKDNGFGVTGMAHEAESFTCYSTTGEGPGQGRTAAIGLAIEGLDAGDVLLYELQTTGGTEPVGAPVDYNQTIWDLTKAGTDAGVIICAAAGNGAQNLDSPLYRDYNKRGDNGSILVGAASHVGRHTMDFSTYGSRVNLCGWGEWVTTTGYGMLHDGGPNAKYCLVFNGTSSATPVVASAAILVQSYAKKHLNKTLTPKEMRDLLVETGTPQGAGGHIGPQPNVKAAILRAKELYGGTESTLSFQSNRRIVQISVVDNELLYHIPQGYSSHVNIELYNLMGVKLGAYEGAVKDGGSYTIPISSIAGVLLSSGAYIARLQTGNQFFNSKFLIK